MTSDTQTRAANGLPLVISTQTQTPTARLVMRNDLGEVVQQWLVRQSKSTLGSAGSCALRCTAAGIAPYHALIVLGSRQIFLRSLAPKITRLGKQVTELLIEEEDFEFEIAGHKFQITRKPSSDRASTSKADKSSDRLRFTLARPLQLDNRSSTQAQASGKNKRVNQSSLPNLGPKNVSNAYLFADDLGGVVPPSSIPGLDELIRDAVRPLERRIARALEPLAELKTEAEEQRVSNQNEREVWKNIAEENFRAALGGVSVDSNQQDQQLRQEIKEEVSTAIAKHSATVDVLTERISDVNHQLASIERIVLEEKSRDSRSSESQQETLRVQNEAIDQLQSGILAVTETIGAIQERQQNERADEQSWKSQLDEKLSAIHERLEQAAASDREPLAAQLTDSMNRLEKSQESTLQQLTDWKGDIESRLDAVKESLRTQAQHEQRAQGQGSDSAKAIEAMTSSLAEKIDQLSDSSVAIHNWFNEMEDWKPQIAEQLSSFQATLESLAERPAIVAHPELSTATAEDADRANVNQLFSDAASSEQQEHWVGPEALGTHEDPHVGDAQGESTGEQPFSVESLSVEQALSTDNELPIAIEHHGAVEFDGFDMAARAESGEGSFSEHPLDVAEEESIDYSNLVGSSDTDEFASSSTSEPAESFSVGDWEEPTAGAASTGEDTTDPTEKQRAIFAQLTNGNQSESIVENTSGELPAISAGEAHDSPELPSLLGGVEDQATFDSEGAFENDAIASSASFSAPGKSEQNAFTGESFTESASEEMPLGENQPNASDLSYAPESENASSPQFDPAEFSKQFLPTQEQPFVAEDTAAEASDVKVEEAVGVERGVEPEYASVEESQDAGGLPSWWNDDATGANEEAFDEPASDVVASDRTFTGAEAVEEHFNEPESDSFDFGDSPASSEAFGELPHQYADAEPSGVGSSNDSVSGFSSFADLPYDAPEHAAQDAIRAFLQEANAEIDSPVIGSSPDQDAALIREATEEGSSYAAAGSDEGGDSDAGFGGQDQPLAPNALSGDGEQQFETLMMSGEPYEESANSEPDFSGLHNEGAEESTASPMSGAYMQDAATPPETPMTNSDPNSEELNQGESGEEGEESVEEYMRKLLARMRGVPEEEIEVPKVVKESNSLSTPTSAPQSKVQQFTAQSTSSTERQQPSRSDASVNPTEMSNAGAGAMGGAMQQDSAASHGFTQSADGSQEGNPDIDPGNLKPRVAPERSKNMAAMRDLANSSARTAISKSNRQKHFTTSMLKLAIATIGLTVGAVLIAINGFALNIGLIATVAAFIVAGIWGWDGVTSLRPMLKEGLVLQPAIGKKSDQAKD